MSRKKLYLCVLGSLACCVQPALADDSTMESITVEARADDSDVLPGGSRVDAAVIRMLRSATSDAASLLRNVPGLNLNATGGVSSLPSIRGLADDRLRIKVDGMDLIASCPNHMNPPLSYVDPSNVGEVKVFAGISPVSVGGDSIGGTIQLETLAPEFAVAGDDDIVKGELGAFYRGNNEAYGGNATATYASDRLSVRYSGSWSQADNYSAGGNFKRSTATDRIGHSLALDEVGSTAYETRNHTLGLALKEGRHLFEADIGYQNMPDQLYPNQRMDLLDNEQMRVNLGWTGEFAWAELQAGLYHETVDHFMDFGPDKRFWYGAQSQPPAATGMGAPCAPVGFMTCAAGMPMYSDSDTVGGSLKANVELASGELLRLGAEFQRYRLDDYWEPSGGGMWPGTFLNINDGERDRTALFAEWESQLDSQWLVLLGARYERLTTDANEVQGYKASLPAPGNQIAEAATFNASDRTKTDDNWDFTALARYRHSDTLDIEFGAARKVRSPNLYERYTWSSWGMAAIMNNFVGDGNGYVGDPGLDPEKAHTVSASLDWHAADRSWQLKAEPYVTRVDDYIDAVAFDPATFREGAFNVLQYANQSARLYGIDLSGQMQLLSNAWGDWGLQGQVNYPRGENRDTGDALYNIMPLNGRLTLTHRYAGWDNAVEWQVVDSKDRGSAVRNEIGTPGYGLLNLRASYSWQRVRLDFGAENLLDKLYYLPTGGAYTGQGSTMRITGVDWGVGVPGMGRSLYTGVTVTF